MSMKLPTNREGLRYGYTTGSCAAAAASAATQMLFDEKDVAAVRLMTPKGIELLLDILHIERTERSVRCSVKKDAGDDPDVTDGIEIYALASWDIGDAITVDGGTGVGRVTRPGLDQPVGAAAINHIPREMIIREVERVRREHGSNRGIRIMIEIPEGVALAEQTFNPRLGIVGGISVLGTSGIVEPMSEEALKQTIHAELSVRYAEGNREVTIVPGNFGLDFLEHKGHDIEAAVKCSNFIGDALDFAVEIGYEKVLLVGHIGKFIKLSGGIFNTHSKVADARMDLLMAHGVRAGVPIERLQELTDCATTEDALQKLKKQGYLEIVMQKVYERTDEYLAHRVKGKLQVQVVMFSTGLGELPHS